MNKQTVIIGLIVLSALGVVLFSFYQTRHLEKEIGVLKEEPQNRQAVITHPQQLVPSRPEDYGMVVFDENAPPATQSDLDSLVSEKVRELKSETLPETWEKIKEKISEDSKRTEDKVKQIDENIKKCEEMLKLEPDNKEIKGKLERLMMLKSIARQFHQ